MIKKILIANRGEIACRVIKTAKAMGIKTVAVYSDADKQALHVKLADEAAYIGEAPSKLSYLCADKVLDVALSLGADAIHPGYGFLSENAGFAKACADKGVIFIGPPAPAIEAMGSKSAAKSIMEKAGVPLVPGYHGEDQDTELLRKAAEDMGYPVLLKAAAGGGGKGMRQVAKAEEFDQALAAAKREAIASFGDDTMLVEKYLTRPRHVEFQIFCDQHGNGVYLFERDCSLQRRHQKVIEEAPAPHMSETLRQTMGDAAIKAAQAINYEGAGTVEFLLDEDGSFYFMEMNTRLQVEHPVTEMITGEDLVAWQIQIADGLPLPKQQNELRLNGHAFEARIYAEDPDNGFLPATGILSLLTPPAESRYVRVDTGVLQGDEVSVFYDPMIAKLIVWDTDREKALQRLATALRDYHIAGVTTNTDYLHRLATHPEFIAANLTTTFIDKHSSSLEKQNTVPAELNAVMALTQVLPEQQKAAVSSLWNDVSAWRMNSVYQRNVSFTVADSQVDAVVTWPHSKQPRWSVTINDQHWLLDGTLDGNQLTVTVGNIRKQFTLYHSDSQWALFGDSAPVYFVPSRIDLGENDSHHSDSHFNAPMNGTIVACPVAAGTAVKAGTVLVVMEAMKMEHNITAPKDGTVAELFCQAGDMVSGGQVLLEFEADE